MSIDDDFYLNCAKAKELYKKLSDCAVLLDYIERICTSFPAKRAELIPELRNLIDTFDEIREQGCGQFADLSHEEIKKKIKELVSSSVKYGAIKEGEPPPH